MPQVSVDIDLDEIDTDDLVEEVCRRLKRDFQRRSALTSKEKEDIKEAITPLNEILLITPTKIIEIKTLEDKMKYDHLSSVWSRYSSAQIESALP